MRCVVFALVVLPVVPSLCLAQTERRSFPFAPQPPDRCDYFLITEFSVNALAVKVQHGHLGDQFLYTDSFGFMKNSGRSALGASADVHLNRATGEQAEVKLAPTMRYKRWFAGKQSLDLSLGYVLRGKDPGLEGPIGALRYSPLTTFYLQVGACQFREINPVPGSFPYQYREETKTRLFAGAGIGGAPGAVLWGLQVVGLIIFAGGMQSAAL